MEGSTQKRPGSCDSTNVNIVYVEKYKLMRAVREAVVGVRSWEEGRYG
jgi:hypothetical protein